MSFSSYNELQAYQRSRREKAEKDYRQTKQRLGNEHKDELECFDNEYRAKRLQILKGHKEIMQDIAQEHKTKLESLLQLSNEEKQKYRTDGTSKYMKKVKNKASAQVKTTKISVQKQSTSTKVVNQGNGNVAATVATLQSKSTYISSANKENTVITVHEDEPSIDSDIESVHEFPSEPTKRKRDESEAIPDANIQGRILNKRKKLTDYFSKKETRPVFTPLQYNTNYQVNYSHGDETLKEAESDSESVILERLVNESDHELDHDMDHQPEPAAIPSTQAFMFHTSSEDEDDTSGCSTSGPSSNEGSQRVQSQVSSDTHDLIKDTIEHILATVIKHVNQDS